MPFDLKHLIDQQISVNQQQSEHQIGLGVKINPRAKLSPPSGGYGGASSLGVVTSLNSEGEDALTGAVSICGFGGFQSTQSGNKISIQPSEISCISSCLLFGQEYTMQAPSSLKTIYLQRIVSPGILQLKTLRFALEIITGKTPNKDADLIDFAVFEKVKSKFTRKVHFGLHSFNNLTNISGNTFYVSLSSIVDLNQSEYWVAWQFYGAATSDYSFAQNTVNSILFQSGLLIITTSNNDPLPETVSMPESQQNQSKTLWFELLDQ